MFYCTWLLWVSNFLRWLEPAMPNMYFGKTAFKETTLSPIWFTFSYLKFKDHQCSIWKFCFVLKSPWNAALPPQTLTALLCTIHHVLVTVDRLISSKLALADVRHQMAYWDKKWNMEIAVNPEDWTTMQPQMPLILFLSWPASLLSTAIFWKLLRL